MQVLFEVQALGDFPGEQDEDLGFKDREILTILESRYILTEWHKYTIVTLASTCACVSARICMPLYIAYNHYVLHTIAVTMVGCWRRMHLVKEALSPATMYRYKDIKIISLGLCFLSALFTIGCCHSDFLMNPQECSPL